MDGSYAFDAEGLATALAAPRWSIDALRSVQADLRRLEVALAAGVSEDVSARWAEQAVANAAAVDPTLGQVVAEGVRGKPRATAREWITRTLALLGAIETVKTAAADGVAVFEQVHPLVQAFLGGFTHG